MKSIQFSDGSKIDILEDTDPESPREWDNLGTMICFYRRYSLGDKHSYSSSQFESWKEFAKQLIKDHNPAVILPLYLMDHSGLSISVSSGMFRAVDSVGWDWGQVGFILVAREKVLREFNCKKISAKLRARVEGILRLEVKVYNQYLAGDCYGYELKDVSDNVIDSCWGFFGTESIADHLPVKYQKEFLAEL